MSSLGPVVREHKVSMGGLISWLAAAAIGAVGGPFILHWGLTHRPVSLHHAFGGLVLLGLTVWALAEWNRLRRLSLALHELGIQLRVGESSSDATWGEVQALEARYVPGLRRKGTADEGNCVSFLVLTAKSGWLELPKELESFPEIRRTIAQRSGRTVQQVLIQNLTQR